MRTTLTLDDDVARLVEDAVHHERRPMKKVVNDALRRALAPEAVRRQAYHLTPHESAVRPGFDPSGFNRLADELEDEAILRGAQRARLARAGHRRLDPRGVDHRPLLAINGDLDAPDHLAMAEQLAHTVTNGRVVTVPDTAHYPNLEQPSLFNKILADFLHTLSHSGGRLAA